MVSVRAATVGDELDVASVHVRSWQVGYRGLIPDEVLRQIQPEERASRYTFGDGRETSLQTIVAVEDQVILAFATLGASREAERANVGEILALYVDPEHWGRGVGRTLIHDARKLFGEQFYTSANLWVLEGNLRAMRFYEADGWSADGLEREAVVWGVAVTELRYSRTLD